MLLFNKLFFNSTSRQNCRFKTSTFTPLTAEAWEQLRKERLNKHTYKAFSVDFLKIKNKDYDNLCKKIARLNVKRNALPLSAVAERQVIDKKITSIQEFRRAFPYRI